MSTKFILVILTYVLTTIYTVNIRSSKDIRRTYYCSPGKMFIHDVNNTLLFSYNSGQTWNHITPKEEIRSIELFQEGERDEIVLVTGLNLFYSRDCGMDFEESRVVEDTFIDSFKFNKYNPEIGLAVVKTVDLHGSLYATRNFGERWDLLTHKVLTYAW
jgi:hypothetical protein